MDFVINTYSANYPHNICITSDTDTYEVCSKNNRNSFYKFLLFNIQLIILQSTPFLYSHTCPRSVSASPRSPGKHLFLISFNASDEFFLMSPTVSKQHPFSTDFNFGNKKKWQEARSGGRTVV